MNRETAMQLRGQAVRGLIVAVGDGSAAQTVDVETHDGVVRGGIEVMQQFGIASMAPDGALTVVIAMGGDQGDMVALPPSCPGLRFGNLQPGEAVLYDADGNRVHLRAGGVIEVQAATKVKVSAPEVEIIAPIITITGDVTLNGTLTATGEIKSGSIPLTSHKHTGVQAGGATSGAPTP